MGKTIFLIEGIGVAVSSHSHDSLNKGQGWISAVKKFSENSNFQISDLNWMGLLGKLFFTIPFSIEICSK